MLEQQIQKTINAFLKEQEKDFRAFNTYIDEFVKDINSREKL